MPGLLLFILLAAGLSSPGFSQSEFLEDKTVEIVKSITDNDFQNTFELIKKLGKSQPPITDCLRAIAYFEAMSSYRILSFEDEFNSSIEKAIEQLKNSELDKDNFNKARRLQFLGLAYGYRGMYRIRKNLHAYLEKQAFVDL